MAEAMLRFRYILQTHISSVLNAHKLREPEF